TVRPPPAADTEPLVAITAPADAAVVLAGTPVTFSGTANDLEDGPLGARLVWTSDRDGTLGTGASLTQPLSPGPHRITAAVTDTGGLVGTATVGVTVVRVATLEVAPAADAYVDAGSPSANFGTKPLLRVNANPARVPYLRFVVAGVGSQRVVRAVLRLQPDASSAAASPSGGVVRTISNHAWQESTVAYTTRPPVDGPVVGTIGAVRTAQSVEVDITGAVTGDGTYDLALVASSPDEALYRSRETTTPPKLVLTLTGNPPTVAITAPPTGAVFFAGAPVTLAGTARDVEDGDLTTGIHWTSSLDGPLGDGPSVTASSLQVGTHTITAAVADSDGRAAQAQATDRVRGPNLPPRVTITPTPPVVTIATPAPGTRVIVGTSLTFSATAPDATDGDVSGAIRWTSDLDGRIGGGASVTTSALRPGTHTVTAAATDSGWLV